MQQQIKLEKNVTVELTPQQVQVILAHLIKGSFEQVAGTISSIEQQVLEQITKKEEPKKEQE